MTHPDRNLLEQLARDGRLSAEGLEIALAQLSYLPDMQRWRRFGDLALLAGGALLMLSGVVFFFAYNWDALSRFAKLGLVAVPLVACATLAAHFDGRRSGQAWLGAAVVLTGVLLAVIGQIYQTGADSELLFAGWALLALPWVITGRAAWLWLFWLLLLNVALSLFLYGRIDVWFSFFVTDGMFWAPLLLNAVALAIWEFAWTRIDWMRAPYATRALAIFTAAAATSIGAAWFFLGARWFFFNADRDWHVMRYTPLIYLAWIVATAWFYGRHRRDIVPLAVAAVSLIIVVTAGMIRWLLETDLDNSTGVLVVGLVIAATTTAAAIWLRRTIQTCKAEA